jgi:hypothetical protein
VYVRKNLAGRNQQGGAAIDSIAIELNLSVDGARNPQVAVAPDIPFMPTVSYGHIIITTTNGSRLTLSMKNLSSMTGALPA